MNQLNPRSTACRLWIFLFVFVTTSFFLNAQSADLNKALKNFMRATSSGDAEQLIELIHPEIIEKYGGRERFLRNNELKALRLYELREVSEIMNLEGISYASASYIGIVTMDMSEAKGQGGMGMAISTMLMRLRAEQGEENVSFDEETYEIKVKGVDAKVVAIKDPEYSGWKIVPANGRKPEGIIPEKVQRHFENRLLYSLSDEIYDASEEFISAINKKDIDEESEWFLNDSDYFKYKDAKGLKGLDALFSFTALDTIYWAQEYEDTYVALLAFSGNLTTDPFFVEDHPLSLYEDDLIMLAAREKEEENWKFMWDRHDFYYLPSKLKPSEYFDRLEKELEEKRRIQQWIDYNKEIRGIPAHPDWQTIEGSWSGWDNAGITTYTFNSDGTYNYYYVQQNGYDNEYSETYEYLEEEGLIMMKGYDRRDQYFKQLKDGTAIISPRREEFHENNVFNEGTNYVLFRDGFNPGSEINNEVEAALVERQRMVVFNLMMKAGIPIQWTSIHSERISDKFFLEKLSCDTLKEDKLFKVHFDTYAKHGLEWNYYVWEGSMADWESNQCVINMAMARKLAGSESEINKLIGTKFPCDPELIITGILEPGEHYDQEEIPASIPIVFSFE